MPWNGTLVPFPRNAEDGMAISEKPLLSEAEYLEMEREAETKSEFFRGEIFAMAGASRRHNLIVANLIVELGSRLRGGSCRVYPGDMRLKVTETGLIAYPDAMVACDPERFADEREDVLLNPTVIVEVLSDSTERYDRGDKFRHYRTLDSLREYLLVSQKVRYVERFFRNAAGHWELRTVSEPEASIRIEAIGCEIPLAGVYAGIVP
jgi:Uma2 family endonuclease